MIGYMGVNIFWVWDNELPLREPGFYLTLTSWYAFLVKLGRGSFIIELLGVPIDIIRTPDCYSRRMGSSLQKVRKSRLSLSFMLGLIVVITLDLLA